MSSKPDTIIKYLEKQRGVDFSDCCHSIIERQLDQRLSKTGNKTYQKYFSHLQTHPQELNNLVDALTISTLVKDITTNITVNIFATDIDKGSIDKARKSAYKKESLYGGFDIILCRNVLIYYNTEYQNRILTKLFRSLNDNGYLVLGETEVPTRRFHDSFKKVTDCCQIYIKNSMVA